MKVSSPCAVDVSFNEVEALALKAARGAGVSWGLAEEAGYAARWLAEHDLPWFDAVLMRCTAPLGVQREITEAAAPFEVLRSQILCPLLIGGFFADGGMPGAGCDDLDVVAPLLLIPMLARVRKPLRVRVGPDIEIVVGDQTVSGTWTSSWPARSAVTIKPAPQTSGAQPWRVVKRPAPIPHARLDAIAAFERLTYVPASETSRAVGAGSGLSDND